MTKTLLQYGPHNYVRCVSLDDKLRSESGHAILERNPVPLSTSQNYALLSWTTSTASLPMSDLLTGERSDGIP